MADPPPPPPPPHGQNPRPPGGLPDGNYDIFIIPPHSSGSGFLYLPSMQPHRNSFLAGVACTLFVVGIYSLILPVIKHWLDLVMSGGGGLGVVVLLIAVGVGAWTWGKTQAENQANSNAGGPGAGAGASGSQRQRSQQQQSSGPPPNFHAPPPQPDPPPRPSPNANAWEKAREETRKREEERKRAEELKRKREEAQKQREEQERAAKAEAEKKKWEQARAREKEAREREARERIAKERLAREKEAREKDAREREAREKAEKDKKAQTAPSARSSPTKGYEKPTAKSAAGTETYSYRPYDTPRAAKTATYKSSASSISGLSESYAPSQSTARTTPPPSHRGPYSTNEEGKIQIKAVYLFSDIFPTKPISQLVANQGHVTDGLILRIQTEGLFIDDDVRGVPQREWDVKAWTLKLLEDGVVRTPSGHGLHVFRATTRDTENKKYTFVLDESEAWKVAIGISRIRKGSQVRSLGMSGMKENEVKGLLMSLGWM